MENSVQRRKLNLRLERTAIRQLLHTGQQSDIEGGGLYDARSGCINLWCSPEDKPICWNVSVEAGGLDFPRSYVGSLEWEWNEDETAELFVEATPYDLLDRQEEQTLPLETWEQLLDWLEAKARALMALAEATPQIIGTHCPFCSYILPYGELLNTLLAHIADAHPHERATGLIIGEHAQLATKNDTYPLLDAEERVSG